MCKFCSFKEDGMAESDFTAIHDLGILGNLVGYCGIELDANKNFSLFVNVTIDNNRSDDLENFENMVSTDVINQRIYYCPMCGRKLDE